MIVYLPQSYSVCNSYEYENRIMVLPSETASEISLNNIQLELLRILYMNEWKCLNNDNYVNVQVIFF